MSSTDRAQAQLEAERLVEGIRFPADVLTASPGYWHHSFDLSDGTRIAGGKAASVLEAEFGAVFGPVDLAGASVLDVGAWNGAFAFEAERRGAGRVMAVDEPVWLHDDLRGLEKFLFVRKDKRSTVEYRVLDLPATTVANLGPFDVVLFLGVFYHLQDPLAVLDAMAGLARRCLVVETHLDAEDAPYPAMRYYPQAELQGDDSNWWGPNPACVEALLRVAGFARVLFHRHEAAPSRGIFHAFR